MPKKNNLPDLRLLDLDSVVVRMQNTSRCNWPIAFTLRVAKEYKKFINLCRLYPEKKLVPSYQINEFWKNHIIGLSKYMKDCEEFLGKTLMNADYDDRDEKAWKETLKLYKKHEGDYAHVAYWLEPWEISDETR